MSKPDVRARAEQPWPIRLTHGLNVPLLGVMAASGLQIFMAFSSFGPRGARYGWVPAHGIHVPAWLQMGGWLEGARGLHFAFGWLLVASGLQRLGYTTALLLGILEMGSGLDLWKLAQLHTLGVPLFS